MEEGRGRGDGSLLLLEWEPESDSESVSEPEPESDPEGEADLEPPEARLSPLEEDRERAIPSVMSSPCSTARLGATKAER